VDRREIGRRIAHLKRELEEVRKHRAQYRRRRTEEAIPVVALVGYTNAGKSTLLNALSGSDVYAADQLFATLDPTTRRVKLPGGREVLVTDTVGFIQKLPTALVAAFRATLEEIADADVIVHVVDITHENVEEQVATVVQVLHDLEATDQPMITALNKLDLLPGAEEVDLAEAGLPNSVPISGLTGQGVPELLSRLEQVLDEDMALIDVVLPYSRGDMLALIHQRGMILRETHDENGMAVVARVPASMAARFQQYSQI
jgi:GTP-binding protein HflX